VTSIVDALESELTGRFAIYGHSMGAMLGFSVAHEMRRRSRREPAHLFVSGRRAPQLRHASPMHHLADRELVEALRRLGGIPEAVLYSELMEVFLPVLRADIAVSEAETAVPKVPLACPITALGGLADPRANRDELDAWHVHTSGAFDCEIFPGAHFFIQTERAAVLGSLARRLARLAPLSMTGSG
jgi:medium-chain acyl-[acyl-carrier-protein] hydrolase